MSHKLQNYLRTYRKRAGLSQDDVAFLLGCGSGTKLSRYECFGRTPALETALACAIVYGAPCREVFAGMWEKAEKDIKHRAQLLTRKIEKSQPEPIMLRKLEALRAISSGSAPAPAQSSL
jgi:transcriptional regulator with XRE-family HTH domain